MEGTIEWWMVKDQGARRRKSKDADEGWIEWTWLACASNVTFGRGVLACSGTVDGWTVRW